MAFSQKDKAEIRVLRQGKEMKKLTSKFPNENWSQSTLNNFQPKHPVQKHTYTVGAYCGQQTRLW